jgi:hypothetical protein
VLGCEIPPVTGPTTLALACLEYAGLIRAN